MPKIIQTAAAVICLISSDALLAEDFNNDSVIALTEAGLDDDVILSKIDALSCQYDVSTDALIHLRNSGVSAVVITAMVQRALVRRRRRDQA